MGKTTRNVWNDLSVYNWADLDSGTHVYTCVYIKYLPRLFRKVTMNLGSVIIHILLYFIQVSAWDNRQICIVYSQSALQKHLAESAKSDFPKKISWTWIWFTLPTKEKTFRNVRPNRDYMCTNLWRERKNPPRKEFKHKNRQGSWFTQWGLC